MGDVRNRSVDVSVMEEGTEGTHVPPSSVDHFTSILAEGVNELIIPNKEILERGNQNASLDTSIARSGIKAVTGTIPLEWKAGDSGAAPEYGIVLESALGTLDAAVASAASDDSSHSATSIKFSATAAYQAGDIVLIEESGAYHVSPIESVVTNTSIELLVPCPGGAPANEVAVTKLIDYRTADSGFKSFSVTGFDEDAVKHTAAGCKVGTLAGENWTTGQFPQLTASYEGMSFTRVVSANVYDPSLDASLPPVILNACIYKDGISIALNDFTFSLENTLAPKTTTCNENGRTGIRQTDRKITGAINPYMEDDSVALFDEWEDDDTFTLFGFAYNPTSTDGEFEEVIAFYFPVCQFNEIGRSDINGLAQNAMTFSVRDGGTNPTAVLAFGE